MISNLMRQLVYNEGLFSINRRSDINSLCKYAFNITGKLLEGAM